jgi:hypothetical protein
MTAYLVLTQHRTIDAAALAAYRRLAPASAAGHPITQAPWNDVTVKLVCCVAGTSPEA